jgi:invasion protein IalB
MDCSNRNFRWSGGRLRARSCFLAALAAFVLSAPHAAQAQQQQQQPAPQAQQAVPTKQGGGEAQNSWVKLCQEQETVQDGVVKPVEVCLTHHERLSAVNGMVLVSVALRKIAGQENEHLMVLVPLGVALPPGLQVVVDGGEPIELKFTFCHVGGCTAEAVANESIVESFKKGKELKVLALNNTGKTVAFPVPLKGFTKAYTGEPVDSEKYHEARKQLMQRIRERQLELAKKAGEGEDGEEGQQQLQMPGQPQGGQLPGQQSPTQPFAPNPSPKPSQ